jgi:hypothetical protein
MSALRGAQLSGFREGEVKVEVPAKTLSTDDKKVKTPSPKFAIYIAKQQQVLNSLLSSLSKEMIDYVVAYTTL